MTLSYVYSAIMRGKWFISLNDVEANHMVVLDVLQNNNKDLDGTILSQRKPLEVEMVHDKTASSTKMADSERDGAAVAIIPLHGTMLKYGTFCSYGCDEIADKIYEAANNSKVGQIILDIDSGGGAVDAIAPLRDAIAYAKSKGKKTLAHCDLCASAAYFVACACDEIMASNDISAEFGSIGVMMSFPDYAKYYESLGVKIHTIYSNLSTYKNAPFELAKAGEYDKIKEEELDPLARRFQETVRESRSGKLDEKVEGILAGRMFYAKDAIKNGLADSIGDKQAAIARVRELSASAMINEYLNSKA